MGRGHLFLGLAFCLNHLLVFFFVERTLPESFFGDANPSPTLCCRGLHDACIVFVFGARLRPSVAEVCKRAVMHVYGARLRRSVAEVCKKSCDACVFLEPPSPTLCCRDLQKSCDACIVFVFGARVTRGRSQRTLVACRLWRAEPSRCVSLRL